MISAQSSDHTLTHLQQGAITHALIARKLGQHNNSTFRTMTISVIYGIPNIYIYLPWSLRGTFNSMNEVSGFLNTCFFAHSIHQFGNL